MNLTYLQSSAVMISNNDAKLLCDPWLVDGELYGSWSHYPPSKFKPEEFNDVDFIYLSHIHQDHFSQKTLSQMNKDIPIVIYNFESKSLKIMSVMFFNPSCFLFPEENNCLPGETFKISEKDKLVKFTSYKKFNFRQNKFQIISNYISFLSFMGSLLYLVYSFLIFIYNSRKKY